MAPTSAYFTFKSSHFSTSWARNWFTDLDLVCSDGNNISVHKIIVGTAFSTIQKELLAKDCRFIKVNHPYRIIKLLLDLVYVGEARVQTDDVEAFAKAGADLGLDGGKKLRRKLLKEEEDTEKQEKPNSFGHFVSMDSSVMKKFEESERAGKRMTFRWVLPQATSTEPPKPEPTKLIQHFGNVEPPAKKMKITKTKLKPLAKTAKKSTEGSDSFTGMLATSAAKMNFKAKDSAPLVFYACTFSKCDKKFQRKGNLEAHYAKAHGPVSSNLQENCAQQ